MRLRRMLLMLATVILSIAVAASCSKDKSDEPDKPDTPKTEIDSQLLGTWESKLILGEKSSLMRITFKDDQTMTLSEKAVLGENQDFELEASGNWKAVDGTLTVVLTEASIPEFKGKAYIGKYEVLVGQLYFQNLFLFPFDKVD